MMTIRTLFQRLTSRRDDTIAALYGAIVAQARQPVFYQNYRVPDSFDGRLEMIMLHIMLALRHLREEEKPMGQHLFDHFCADIDGNLREAGVGDLAIPKRMQAIASGFYGRFAAYKAALEHDNIEVLENALARNVYGGHCEIMGVRDLALYVRNADRMVREDLQSRPLNAVGITFPSPMRGTGEGGPP